MRAGLRALAFGDIEAGSWGAAWMPDPGGSGSLAVHAAAGAAVTSAALRGSDPGEEWRLRGDSASLVLTPAGAPGSSGAEGSGMEGFDQLCRVTGRLLIHGVEQEVDCLGWREVRTGALDLDRIGSFRQVSAWFEPGEGLALLALRPRKSKGQESDLLAATVLDPEMTCAVADPRLSTTYTADGLPARAGLELWLGKEDAKPADDESARYPRRAAGEAVGAGIDWTVAGFELHARLLRWHAHGQDGAGVYMLGKRR